MLQIPISPKYTEYLHNKASAARIPLTLSFELTPLCNMACRMCYVRMDREAQEKIRPLRTAEEWLTLAAQARDEGLLYLLLTGGEPFLFPEFRKLLPALHEMGLIISINSNGTLIDEETISWLKKSPPNRINMTLYGSSNETYARLCGNPNGFSQASRAIDLLREAGITVKINMSMTPYNAQDLEGIFAFCEQKNLLIQASSYMFPPMRRDRSCIGRNDRFTPEEAAYCAAKIQTGLIGPEAFIERADSGRFSLPLEENDDSCVQDKNAEGSRILCRAGSCSGWVTWEGKLLMCGMIPDENAPDAFGGNFRNAWNYVTEKAAAIRLPVPCSTCALADTCKACAAMVYTETGSFSKVPEYRCKMAHAYPGEALRLADELRRSRSGGTK